MTLKKQIVLVMKQTVLNILVTVDIIFILGKTAKNTVFNTNCVTFNVKVLRAAAASPVPLDTSLYLLAFRENKTQKNTKQ